MYILTYRNYSGGNYPYVLHGKKGQPITSELNGLANQQTSSLLTLPETLTTDTTATTSSAITGGKIAKQKLKDKLDLVKLHDPKTKLRKFINLKI
jgi:hypothetical protein